MNDRGFPGAESIASTTRKRRRRVAAPDRLVVEWRVDLGSLPREFVDRETIARARREGAITLIAVRSPDDLGDVRVTTWLHCAGDGEPRPLPMRAAGRHVAWIDDPRGMTHLEIDTPQWRCSVTLQRDAEGCRLRYALTNLFEKLGVRGGRYEPRQGSCANCDTADLARHSA
jgi:hypothetical protein